MEELIMKKIITSLLTACMMISVFAGCSTQNPTDNKNVQGATNTNTPVPTTALTTTLAPLEETVSTPKYVFLFIGDGMSYPQIQSTADYLGALNDEDYVFSVKCLTLQFV